MGNLWSWSCPDAPRRHGSMGPRAAAGVQKSLIGCSIAIRGGLIGLFSRLSWFGALKRCRHGWRGRWGVAAAGAAVEQARRAVCVRLGGDREQPRLAPPTTSTSASRRLPANRLSAGWACQVPSLLPTNPNRRHPVSSQTSPAHVDPSPEHSPADRLPSWAQYGDGPWWENGNGTWK